jgi:mannose-6-phosphate isomerase-like protein (cupin superfamily)
MVRYVPRRAERSEGAPKGKEKAMSQAGMIIRGEGEGERLWFAGGGLWTMKADGAFILVEDRMSLDKMTPLHTHPNQDETLIVLEGEILV